MEGKTVKGTRSALTERALRDSLSSEGLILLSSTADVGEQAGVRLKTTEIADFCRQLAAMLSAGVPLIRAINILMKRDLKPRVRSVYTALYGALQAGVPLSEAMEQQGGFPTLLVSAFRASEVSGHMDNTAKQMAVHYDKEHRINGKVRTAAFYPLFLLLLTVLIVSVIFRFILPQFFTLFEGMELPGITQFVLNVSTAFSEHGLYILIGVLLAVLLLSFVFRQKDVRRALDRFKLRIPYVGRLLKIIYTARFARTLSSLYSSGLTILSALQNTRDTVGNTYISSQFDALITDVRNGASLSAAIAKVDGFDAKLTGTVNVGEESGNLEYMLTTMADSFDFESEQALDKLTSLIGPILIIFMAIIIGTIIISVMLPILTLYDTIGTGAFGF